MLVTDFNDIAQEHYARVLEFAKAIGKLDDLTQQLDYLDTYASGEGCTYDKAKTGGTRCLLFKDHAPYSFQFVMECRAHPSMPWERWFNGGVIFEGPTQPLNGSAPAFTVSCGEPKVGWSIHT